MKKNLTFFEIFKITIPVLLGYISVGIAFGLLAQQLGFSWYIAMFMSIIIYAGAAQFLAISLMAQKSGYFDIAIATFLLNLRHSFYGLSMIKAFKNLGFIKKYMIFSLTDETFAILQTIKEIKDEKEKKRSYFLISILNQSYWIIGTLMGSLIGSKIDINYKGIEFALTALFVVLSIELYKKYPNKRVLFLSFFVGFIGLFLPSSKMLLLCLCTSLFLLIVLKDWIKP